MIKTIKVFLGVCMFVLGSINLYAQTDTIIIKTSAICDECKERIEHDLSFEKGVKSAKLDLETKMVTVVYNSDKTSPAKIAEAITKIGYDADSLKADAKAFKKLPECCQRPMGY
jgi:periplasmic mercuric ion binding protein